MPEITKKAQLDWLQTQRDAVNANIVAAGPQEEGKYKTELQIINAITERVKEMTAVEYFITIKEMCENEEKCMRCNLLPAGNCHRYSVDFPSDPCRAVEIVKRWKEEQA